MASVSFGMRFLFSYLVKESLWVVESLYVFQASACFRFRLMALPLFVKFSNKNLSASNVASAVEV